MQKQIVRATASLFLMLNVGGSLAVAQSQPRTNLVYTENCIRAEYCSVSRLLSKDFVGSSTNGSLFKLLLLGGETMERNRRKITKWSDQPHTVYVFCSKQYPAVLIRNNDDSVQTTLLEIGKGIPAVLTSDLLIYARTCHDLSNAYDDSVLAKRFDYHPDVATFQRLEKEIKEPADLLKFRQ